MFGATDRALAGERGPGFQLTLSDLDDDVLLGSYPKLARTLQQMGDVRDVLVWPFLHYQLGGLAYDLNGRTSLPRVFAAGEVTGGLHGRNRLMGAGITDALVHGWRAGGAAACEVHGRRT
jgi:aspartate oxidase